MRRASPRSGAIATRARAESTVLTNVSRHVHTDTILSSTPDSRNVVHLVQAQAPVDTRRNFKIHPWGHRNTHHHHITHHHHHHVRLNRQAGVLDASGRAKGTIVIHSILDTVCQSQHVPEVHHELDQHTTLRKTLSCIYVYTTAQSIQARAESIQLSRQCNIHMEKLALASSRSQSESPFSPFSGSQILPIS